MKLVDETTQRTFDSVAIGGGEATTLERPCQLVEFPVIVESLQETVEDFSEDFTCRLASEGHRQDLAGVDTGDDQADEAIGQLVGLA